MMTDIPPPNPRPASYVDTEATTGSYLDWPAIIAGGVFALAIAFLLISFGAALGLSLVSPYRGEGVSEAWLAIGAGIWFVWVMVSSFGAGGYLTGRMRRRAGDAIPREVEVRDGAHGVVVWATGALVGTALAAMGVGGLVGIGASAVGSADELADEVTAAVDADYFANLMLRGIDQTQMPADAEAPDAQQPGVQPGEATPEAVNPAVQDQMASIITRSAARGEMPERDRTYLAQLVASYTDLSPTEAQARVDEINMEINAARTQALDAVESARIAGVVFAFITAATLLAAALAAFFAAVAGGRHRDEGLGFDIFTPRR